MLQILENGRLTDSVGRAVDFKNTVIIITSNIGSKYAEKSKSLGFSKETIDEIPYEKFKGKIMEEVKKVMNPEFLNRIDEIIVFHPLTKDDLKKIIDIMLEDILKRLSEKGIKIVLTDNAKEFLIEKGYDPVYGARPLRRTIQKYVEDPLAEEILSGKITSDKIIEVVRENDGLIFIAK